MTNSNKKHEKLKQTILGQGGGWGKGRKKNFKILSISHVNKRVFCR